MASPAPVPCSDTGRNPLSRSNQLSQRAVTRLQECRRLPCYQIQIHRLITAVARQLLFYRAGFADIAGRIADGPPEVVDSLLAWPRHTDWM